MIMENITQNLFSVLILRCFLTGKIQALMMLLVLRQDNQKPTIWLEQKGKCY